MPTSYDDWIGREARATSGLDPWPVAAMQATLGLESGLATLEAPPPLWSWLYFLETPARGTLGPDGHAARGGFVPPVAAPRRMFAGGRFELLRPLRLGAPAEQVQRVLKIEAKPGSAGELVFVTTGYDHYQDGELCVREERDIVYLHPTPLAPEPPPTPVPDAVWSLDLTPDAVLLMKVSALTFNGHRIHYDLPYARDVERYPERVVHGPLIALLLAELPRLQGSLRLSHFAFRARSPLFLGDTLHLRGTPDSQGAMALRAYARSGRLVMTAEAKMAC